MESAESIASSIQQARNLLQKTAQADPQIKKIAQPFIDILQSISDIGGPLISEIKTALQNQDVSQIIPILVDTAPLAQKSIDLIKLIGQGGNQVIQFLSNNSWRTIIQTVVRELFNIIQLNSGPLEALKNDVPQAKELLNKGTQLFNTLRGVTGFLAN